MMCRVNNLVKRLVKVGFSKEEAIVESWQTEVELSELTESQKKKAAKKKKKDPFKKEDKDKKSKVPDKKDMQDKKKAMAEKKLFAGRGGSKGMKNRVESKLKELGLEPLTKQKKTDKKNNDDTKHWDMANVDDKVRAKESGILGKLKKKKKQKKPKEEK